MNSTHSPSHTRRITRYVSGLAPFFLIVLFAFPALLLLLQDQAICTHDGAMHFYRLTALRHAIDQGLVSSRWTPGLVYGYGFPFFNFREIGPYYLPEALFLLGLTIPAALNAVYAGTLLISGWGAYLLGRDIWQDELAGLVAAVAYMYAPYQLLNVYVRGNLPECMALALLPIIVWLFRRLVDAPRIPTFILATLSVAALLLLHNQSSLLFIPLLIAYLAILLSLRRQHVSISHQRRWLLIAASLFIGIGLTAFAWLPAIAEKESVQLYLTHSSRGNDFHFNFLALTDLFAPPTPADPSLLNPPLNVYPGLPQLILGMVGILGLIIFRRLGSTDADRRSTVINSERRWHSALFALATLGLLSFSLPFTTPLWENLPLIRFVQFPWRFVGRASLPLAILAGAVPAFFARRPILFRVSTTISLTVLILAAFPWLYPTTCKNPPSPTIADVMDFERATGQTGVNPLGAYFPRWVVQRPTGSPMEAALREGATPRRFDSTNLPAGATLLQESYGPNRATIKLETPIPFQAVYHTFYFPGWTVQIDKEHVPIKPTAQTGLVSFPVPAGQHTLTIRWGLTPLRAGAAAISVAALMTLVAVSILFRERMNTGESPISVNQPSAPYLILLAFFLLAFKLALVDPGHTPLRRSRLVDGALPGLQYPASFSFADGLELLGHQVTPASAGSEFRIDLAWTARQSPTGRYSTKVTLMDADGLSWSSKETFRPRGYQPHPATAEWRPGAWVWDSHSVPILPGTPPGTYLLKLTVFDRATLTPLNVLDSAGRVAGPDLVLGKLVVERPDTSPVSIPMQHTIDHQWGGLTFLGANLDRTEAAPGDSALMTLFWEARARLPLLTARLDLLDPLGAVLRAWQLPLVREDYPATDWQIDDKLMGQHLLNIPGRAQDGEHTWLLTVLDAAGAPIGPSITLGSLMIRAPDRLWEVPAAISTIDIQYTLPSGASFARLTGYRREPANGDLYLTLVWQAQVEAEASYRVYLQLFGPDGEMVSQSDGVPAAWTRPTSGWAPGEYVIDGHQLPLPEDLPVGEYTLIAGLYDPATGDRLNASQDIMTEITLP